MKRIAIVGGGVSGLSLAHSLVRRGATERGLDVVVLEKSARAGGNLLSQEIDGYLCEAGANGFLDNAPRTLELVRELGLEARLLPSDERSRKRYIYRRGRLHRLPSGALSFLGSRLLTAPAKLRIALEPFASPRPEGDETIHDFAARRIGPEAAHVLVGSMVSGVFGGDARALSLRACFAKLWQMETDHGGLVRALLARIRSGRRRKGEAVGSPLGRLTSFAGGIEELMHGLSRSLGASLRTSANPVAIERLAGGFRLRLLGAASQQAERHEQSLDADAVVLATPPSESARLVRDLDPELSLDLRAIPSAPIAVVALGYDRARIPPLDGFGFLVPRGEGPRALGALWDSSIFQGRAPEGRALLRVMVGGALDPEAACLPESELVAIATGDLEKAMGLRARPLLVHVTRHRLGIPQYTLGHLERLARIDARLAKHPGLFVAGNGYRGVAINACVAEAENLAARVLSLFESRGVG